MEGKGGSKMEGLWKEGPVIPKYQSPGMGKRHMKTKKPHGKGET